MNKHVFVFNITELQKGSGSVFSVHEPLPTDDESRGSGGTANSGGTVIYGKFNLNL